MEKVLIYCRVGNADQVSDEQDEKEGANQEQ